MECDLSRRRFLVAASGAAMIPQMLAARPIEER